MKLKPRHPAKTESVSKLQSGKSPSRMTEWRRKKKKEGWKAFYAYLPKDQLAVLKDVYQKLMAGEEVVFAEKRARPKFNVKSSKPVTPQIAPRWI